MSTYTINNQFPGAAGETYLEITVSFDASNGEHFDFPQEVVTTLSGDALSAQLRAYADDYESHYDADLMAGKGG